MPDKIQVSKADVNIVYYFLKQTHEPLIRKNDGENYSSKVLRSWERNLNNTEFVFCPDTSKKFINQKIFDKKYFEVYISSITQKFDKDFNISKKLDCFKINFKKSQNRYLDFLSYYENSPSLTRNSQIEDGLGDFYVEKIDEDKIILKRKIKIENGYNTIRALKDYQDVNIYDIEDYNLLSEKNIPKEIKKNYNKVKGMYLKSIVLIINYKDKKIRKIIYDNLDIEGLRKAFLIKRDFKFYEISSILPVGVPFAAAGSAKQNKVENIEIDKKHELIFGNYLAEENQEYMDSFFYDFSKKCNIKIKTKKITVSELISKIKPSKFNLSIISIDSTRNDLMPFFEIFGDYSKSMYDFKIYEIANIYERLKKINDKNEQEKLVKKAIKTIEEEALALPLGQVLKNSYYPPHIKNINVGRDFLQYPEISEFRW
ncbi:MAG: hypothetical protein AB1637_04645 [Elusimicrobiota bacterium]